MPKRGNQRKARERTKARKAKAKPEKEARRQRLYEEEAEELVPAASRSEKASSATPAASEAAAKEEETSEPRWWFGRETRAVEQQSWEHWPGQRGLVRAAEATAELDKVGILEFGLQWEKPLEVLDTSAGDTALLTT